MANVLIEESTMSAIGDAIRAKTGKTDLILPSDMATEISEITGGGGSSDLVKYVTFMSEDGTTELFKMPVLSGDDCKDAVSHGDISKPTKESTNTTNYTYSGWSLTAGGSADSSALKNVTEDRTVYASFTESIRYYTVNFYTEVGTLHETVQVTYGGTAEPSSTPTKSGASFQYWTPSNENITADTDCYAVWAEAVTFAGGSWADIARISEAGQAKEYFSVGDKRTVIFDGVEVELVIAGFDHDDLADGSGKAGITIVTNTIASTGMKYTWGSGTSLWGGSRPRTYLNGEAKTKLPSELQPYIKEVLKPSDNSVSTSTHSITTLTDSLFLLSMTEMNLSGTGESGSYSILGNPYAGFVSNKISPNAYVHGGSTMATYWLRQVYRASNGAGPCKYYISVSSTQNMGTTLNTQSNYLRFGFCI